MLDDVDISKWQNYYVNLFGAFTLGKPPKMIYVNGVNYKEVTPPRRIQTYWVQSDLMLLFLGWWHFLIMAINYARPNNQFFPLKIVSPSCTQIITEYEQLL